MSLFKSRIFFTGFVLFLLSANAGASRDRFSRNQVLVTVNGVKITEQQVNEAIEKDLQMAITLGKPPSEAMLFNMKLRAIDDMIERLVIGERIKAKGIKVTFEDVKKEVERIAKINNISVKQFYKRAYSTQNKTAAEVNDNIAMGLRFDKLIVKEAGSRAFDVSDSVAKRYYERNKDKEFTRPARVRASHIMINYPKDDPDGKDKVKFAMSKISSMARKGTDFAKLAKQYSQDKITSKKGGDLGFLTRGYMPKKIEEIAFSSKPGQVSDVIEMPYGCHVIKVFEVDPGGLISFDEAKADIVAWMRDDLKADFSAKYRDQLMANAKIKWAGGKRPEPIKID